MNLVVNKYLYGLMEEILGNYFIINGKVLPVSRFDRSVLKEGTTVYEVLRIIEGRPVFLKEHIDRLKNSIRLKNLQHLFLKTSDIEYFIFLLVEKNNIKTGNIKILFNQAFQDLNYLLSFIPHKYPSEIDYTNGINLKILQASREDPNAKVLNLPMRQEADLMIKKTGAYEVLLTFNDTITEGSRTNIFFIKDQELYTPPKRMVLPGITRMKLLKIAKDQQIPVHQILVKIQTLTKFQSAFITGTSAKILPVKQIEQITFNIHDPLLRRLMNIYDKYLPVF